MLSGRAGIWCAGLGEAADPAQAKAAAQNLEATAQAHAEAQAQNMAHAHNLAAQSFKTGITYDTKIRGKKTQFKVFVGGGCCCLLLMCVCC